MVGSFLLSVIFLFFKLIGKVLLSFRSVIITARRPLDSFANWTRGPLISLSFVNLISRCSLDSCSCVLWAFVRMVLPSAGLLSK